MKMNKNFELGVNAILNIECSTDPTSLLAIGADIPPRLADDELPSMHNFERGFVI
jgi:hypothetical protein